MPQHRQTKKSRYIRKTKLSIRKIARDLRKGLDIDDRHSPDLLQVLARFKGPNHKFRLKEVPDSSLPHAEAKAHCESGILEVRSGILRALDKYGDPRARWTIAHELGHLALGHPGRLFRKRPGEPISRTQEALEYEADTFASEFLAPEHLAKQCQTANEIQRLFQISSDAAARRKTELDQDSRVEIPTPRIEPRRGEGQRTPLGPLPTLSKPSPQSLLAFMAMAFTEDTARLYHEILKPAINEAGVACQRADEISSAEPIADDIRHAIERSHLVVAEISGLNPNVMHEIGLAQSLNKPTILICGDHYKESEIPSNIRHIRRIMYPNDAGGGPILRRQLLQTLETILLSIRTSLKNT